MLESDRAMVEICSVTRGRLIAGEVIGVTALSLLQTILSKLGGSPADRSRVSIPPEPEPPSEFWN